MEDTPMIKFKEFLVQVGCDNFVAIPKAFGTQQEAQKYLAILHKPIYDTVEEDSTYWYFIQKQKMVNPTNKTPTAERTFTGQSNCMNFFPAMQFGVTKYVVQINELEFAKQITEFISSVPKGHIRDFILHSIERGASDTCYVSVQSS